jgi:leucyl-tRNA synthetase
MRDWLISRQRYWGAPIPIVHCPVHGEVPVPEDQLPVLLPDVENYEPTGTGESPLALIPEFVNTTCPTCGGPARRETDTMGGFACSSWYFLRFADPHNAEQAFDPRQAAYWLPVDLYVGGAEHAVMHLLYARFWTKVMYDAGLIPFGEPFQRLRNQGMILAGDGRKMSKSYGNVITPDTVVAQYGADTLRAYEAFISDFALDVPWNERGLVGVYRWLHRVWSLILDAPEDNPPGLAVDPEDERRLRRALHKTIRAVTHDIESFSFNTVVAALMEFTNYLGEARATSVVAGPAWTEALDTLLLLMAPVCPHAAEELWRRTGHAYSVHGQRWPEWSAELAADDEITLVVQVNGKVRDRITVTAGIGEDDARAAALRAPNAARFFEGKRIVKTIYAPGRLINIVVQ